MKAWIVSTTIAAVMMSSTVVSAAANQLDYDGVNRRTVFHCNQYGSISIRAENGEYGRHQIVVSDSTVAQYVTEGRFSDRRCSLDGDPEGRHICFASDGSLVVPAYGSGPYLTAFTWLNSREYSTDGDRFVQLTAWRDGPGVRFQLMSNQGVTGYDCGPSGEGPCRPTYGNIEKKTYRDWYLEGCTAE